MDDLRFDRLARALGRAGNRREGLKAALGGLFGLGAAGAALDGALEADARRRDRRRDAAANDGHGDGDGADGERRKRKKGCKPACGAGFTCVKTGKKRKKRFTCQCLSGVICGEACCAEGQACEGGTCTGGPAPGSCHEMGEFCKQTGRPCCNGLACGSGQQGEDDIGCWIPKGGACASTAECTWGTECRDGVCAPLQCGPGNCDGCCTTTIYGACIGGRDQTDGQCGAGGAICGACPAGKVCRERACVCAPGTRPCGELCIPDASCCTNEVVGCPPNEDCRQGQCRCGDRAGCDEPFTCVANGSGGFACRQCPQGTKPCGNSCIPTDNCCDGGTGVAPNADCAAAGTACDSASGTCTCKSGTKPCGSSCIPVTHCCEGGADFEPDETCQPSGSVCNSSSGNCECGGAPPEICGQNSFCDSVLKCDCPAGKTKCISGDSVTCCESFETCLNGTCITTAALCNGQLCTAGQGCCDGACKNLNNWGTAQVTQFQTTCMSPTPTNCVDATLAPAAPTTNASRIPFYVYVAPDGLTAWAAEQVNDRVSVWTRPNATSLTWTQQATLGGRCTGACTDDQFKLPYSVVASFDGLTAWVADSENNRISVWKRSTSTGTDWTWQVNFGGGCTAVASCTASQLWKPGAVAVSTDTLTAWVTDTGSVGSAGTPGSNGRVQVWTRPNATSTVWTHQGNIGSYGVGANQFRRPRGIFVSPDEQTMWIADDQNSRVAVYRYDAANAGNPNVYARWYEQTTFGYCTGNPLSGQCRAPGVCDGADQFNRPLGVVASLDGTTAYVSDFCNNRVSVWKRSSDTATDWTNVTTFGTPLTGTNTTSGFDEPRGVWVAGDACTAWVADTQNQRISIWKAGN